MPKQTIAEHLLTGVSLTANRQTIADGPDKGVILTIIQIIDGNESYVIPLRSDVRDEFIKQLTGGTIIPSDEVIKQLAVVKS